MEIPTRKIIQLLLFVAIVFIILDLLATGWGSYLEYLFDLDQEANIPTWFSTILLFSVAITSFMIYTSGREINNSITWRFFWPGFSAVFCFLSLDEASGLHEMITSSLNINWIWIYALLGVIFFIICSYFLENVNKNKDLTDRILGGLAIYALGIAMSVFINSYIQLGEAESMLEEGLEMLGTIMVLSGCLRELDRRSRIIKENKVLTKDII